MMGADLRAARKVAGLSQTALARRAGIGRHAVSYWECRARPDLNGWAVKRMLAALGLFGLPYFLTPATRAPARADRVLDDGGIQSPQGQNGNLPLPGSHCPPIRCGAIRKSGKPCRHKVEPDKKRCKFHGGCSTGPKTAEGRARIAEAQRRRWAVRKAEKACPPETGF